MIRSAVVLAAVVLLACPAARTGAAPSPYEGLDVERLATRLESLQMTELLEELARNQRGGGGLLVRRLLIQATIARASKTPDQARRDALLDEAGAGLDKLIAELAKAVEPEQRMAYFDLVLRRIATDAVTKAAPYLYRIQYFHPVSDDAEKVLAMTKAPVKELRRLTNRMQNTHDEWGEDPKNLVMGHYWQLAEMMEHLRYRGSWVRLNRALALPKGADELGLLLRQAIHDVREYADASDNSKGVKFKSLLLTGMAHRLLGEYDKARSYLSRAADKRADPRFQLKAHFETAVSYIEEGKFARANTALATFRREGAALAARRAVPPVAVDFQSAMLEKHLLETRANAVAAKDPTKARQLEDESLQVIQAFITKHPNEKDRVVAMIAAKYAGRDPAGLKGPVLIILGQEAFAKARAAKEPKDRQIHLARTEKILDLVLKDDAATADMKATALWHLALVSNMQKDNLVAADYFRQLADDYPQNALARTAALNAVASLEGDLAENEMPADRGKEFLQRYRQTLYVLIGLSDRKDPQSNMWLYKYAQTLEALGMSKQARDYYDRIGSDSELYEPGRFKILQLDVQTLIRSSDKPSEKRREAEALIAGLRAYRDRARKYSSDKPERVAQVRRWGAQIDLDIAKLTKDVLENSASARALAHDVVQRWPDVPEIKREAQQFRIRLLLADGKVDAAIQPLISLIQENADGTQDLVAAAVNDIQEQLEVLQYRHGEEDAAKFKAYRDAYLVFAEKLWSLAKARITDPDDLYPYKQALARAYEAGTAEQAARAVKLFDELIEQRKAAGEEDWLNYRGLARSNWKLGKHDQAKELYEQLKDRLERKSVEWWRTWLELVRLELEMFADQPAALGAIVKQIDRLRDYDVRLGEYLNQFGRAEKQAKLWIEAAAGR